MASGPSILFLINGFAFLLIGLQLPSILDAMADRAAELIGLGIAVSLTVIVARFVWVFPATYIPRWVSAASPAAGSDPAATAPSSSWAGPGCAAWSRWRPRWRCRLDVPERDLIIYLTFCVILATLVGQGLTLPWVIRAVGLVRGTHEELEEAHARQVAVEAAPRAARGPRRGVSRPHGADRQLRARFDAGGQPCVAGAERQRTDRGRAGAAGPPGDPDVADLDAQRDAIIRLRDDGVIGDTALHRVERDLDLEAVRSGL